VITQKSCAVQLRATTKDIAALCAFADYSIVIGSAGSSFVVVNGSQYNATGVINGSATGSACPVTYAAVGDPVPVRVSFKMARVVGKSLSALSVAVAVDGKRDRATFHAIPLGN
jgi:hypothetical protein